MFYFNNFHETLRDFYKVFVKTFYFILTDIDYHDNEF